MKKTLFSALALTFAGSISLGSIKTYTFSYKTPKNQSLQIKMNAKSYEEAYKAAAKDCFQKLTHGKYPGEEKGLDIIDICANPKS